MYLYNTYGYSTLLYYLYKNNLYIQYGYNTYIYVISAAEPTILPIPLQERSSSFLFQTLEMSTRVCTSTEFIWYIRSRKVVKYMSIFLLNIFWSSYANRSNRNIIRVLDARTSTREIASYNQKLNYPSGWIHWCIRPEGFIPKSNNFFFVRTVELYQIGWIHPDLPLTNDHLFCLISFPLSCHLYSLTSQTHPFLYPVPPLELCPHSRKMKHRSCEGGEKEWKEEGKKYAGALTRLINMSLFPPCLIFHHIHSLVLLCSSSNFIFYSVLQTWRSLHTKFFPPFWYSAFIDWKPLLSPSIYSFSLRNGYQNSFALRSRLYLWRHISWFCEGVAGWWQDVSKHALIIYSKRKENIIQLKITRCKGYNANYHPDNEAGCMYKIPATTDNGFVDFRYYGTRDMICHKGAQSDKYTLKVKAGSTITGTFSTWPESHHGPIINSLSKCDGDCREADLTKQKFDVVSHAGLIHPRPGVPDGTFISNEAAGYWALDEFRERGHIIKFTIPKCLKPGNYIWRYEMIALHSAMVEAQDKGAQHYPYCTNIEVSGDGTQELVGGSSPTNWYNRADPGITINIFRNPTKYIIPGPDISFTCGVNDQTTTPADDTPLPTTTATTLAAASTTTLAAATTTPDSENRDSKHTPLLAQPTFLETSPKFSN